MQITRLRTDSCILAGFVLLICDLCSCDVLHYVDHVAVYLVYRRYRRILTNQHFNECILVIISIILICNLYCVAKIQFSAKS
jgi:cell shape-determining protein MreD